MKLELNDRKYFQKIIAIDIRDIRISYDIERMKELFEDDIDSLGIDESSYPSNVKDILVEFEILPRYSSRVDDDVYELLSRYGINNLPLEYNPCYMDYTYRLSSDSFHIYVYNELLKNAMPKFSYSERLVNEKFINKFFDVEVLKEYMIKKLGTNLLLLVNSMIEEYIANGSNSSMDHYFKIIDPYYDLSNIKDQDLLEEIRKVNIPLLIKMMK